MTEKEKLKFEDAKKAYATLMLCCSFGIEDLDGEIWRDILGYEGDYAESNYGRTKSFKRDKIKILKPRLNQRGYVSVGLCKNDLNSA